MIGSILSLIQGAAGLVSNRSTFIAGAIAAGVVTTTIVGAAAAWHHQIYQSGYDAALADIAEENEATIARAVAKRNVWRDCKARGGQWDQSTGRCQ
jgi:hypothetical protein